MRRGGCYVCKDGMVFPIILAGSYYRHLQGISCLGMPSRIPPVVRGDARLVLHDLAKLTGFSSLRSLRLCCIMSCGDGWCDVAESWEASFLWEVSDMTAKSWVTRLLSRVGPLTHHVELGCYSTWNFTSSWWDVTTNHLHSLFLMRIGNHLQLARVVVSGYGEYDKVGIGMHS